MQEQLDLVTRSLDLLERLASGLGATTYEDALDATTLVTSAARIQDLDFNLLTAFRDAGNRVEIELSQGEWEARVLSTSTTSFEVSVQGPWEDAFADSNAIQAARIAAETNNAGVFLQSSNGMLADIRLTLLNDHLATGAHWLRTVDVLQMLVTRDTWLGFFSLLFETTHPSRLVLQNAGTSSISAGGLVVHGPDVFPDLPTESSAEQVEAYRKAWLRGSRETAPSPTWTVPVRTDGLDDVSSILRGTTELLCWLWLASEAELGTAPIRARFEGMRPVEFDLELGDATDSQDPIALWEWATSTTDPARQEAIQQAVSLSIRDERDLREGSIPVLRTARYLLRISQQGIIAEALATRRTAREAAFTVARGSAEAARSALRKIFDRIVVQLGAAGGVLLANHQALIDRDAALLLLSAILILVAFTALGAYVIDYPGVDKALDAFNKDLDHYRDALPDEDLADIRNMESLVDARSQVRRTRFAAGILLATAGIATIVSLCVVV